MKAAQIAQYGGPEVLKTVHDALKPTIGANQVLVEVHAAGVNPFDWKVREGLARQMAELTFPATLGGDVAGVVAEVGANVTHVKAGDAVYGLAGALSGQGSFADFAPVDGGQIGLRPNNVDFAEAAALPLAGVSAYQALVETLNLQRGQKILIHGGAGGIGTMAIQLAKHLGAYVATTTKASGLSYARSLGADEAIDYRAKKFQDAVSGYDAVFDTIGGEVYEESFKVLKPGGSIVSMSAQPNEELMKRYQVTAISQFTQVTTERLAKLAALVEGGSIVAHIEKAVPLDQASEALRRVQAGELKGKVIIIVKD